MSSLIGILSLLSILSATSYALSCTSCVSYTLTTCTGISVTCPTGHQCGTVYTESKEGGRTNVALVRSCTPSSQCSFKGSINLNQASIRAVTSCCNTDACTPVIPALPTINSTKNGLVCRSCLSGDSNWCYTSDTIHCTGNENMCLLQRTKIGPLSSAIRGCATKSFCDLGSQSQTVGGVSSEVKYICTSGSFSLHKAVLTPAIVGLLLLQLFF